MSDQSIRIATATTAEIAPVVDLIRAQESRQLAQGFRLSEVRSRAELEMHIASALTSATFPLVALDEHSRVRGHAEPALWTLRDDSILLSFLTTRNGIVQNLTLPDPLDRDAAAVLRTLLIALDAFWRSTDTTGELIRWPAGDSWLEPLLYKQSFQLDSVCALRPLQPFFSSRPTPSPSLHVRPALPDDEEALVQLFEDELLFHKPYVPFVHSSPQVLRAFRSKLRQIWTGVELAAGAPLVLVVERDHKVVAMAEMTLLSVEPTDEPGFTPPGQYCCIDNMSVCEDLQGQGIGRLLVQAIEDALPAFQSQLAGYILWFNPANPSASSFWSRLGFQPLWTTYQRLHASKETVTSS